MKLLFTDHPNISLSYISFWFVS